MIARKAQTGNAPAGDIAKTDGAGSGKNAGQRSAAGVCGSEDAANAGACNVRNRNVMLFEDLQHTQVREAAGESATQGQSDAWTRGDVKFGGFRNVFHYKGSFAIAMESPNGPGVPKFQY
jgi:PPE-repeat protein